MKKFYPPIYISSITELKDKTLVKVYFYEVDKEVAKANWKDGENAGGILVETKVYELPPVGADEARKLVYKQVVKENKTKSITI